MYEEIEYKGYTINISDYSVIVVYDGVIMGQFDTEEEAKDYIDTIDETDTGDSVDYRQPTPSEFSEATGIKMTRYNSDTYIETDGKDLAEVEALIREFNEANGSLVSCYYNSNKDAIFIKL